MDPTQDSFINLVISVEILTPLNRESDRAELENLDVKRAEVVRTLATRDEEITSRAQVQGDVNKQRELMDTRQREAIFQMNASDRSYLFDMRDRVYYRRTPFDIQNHLVDLSIKELSTDVAWSGSIRIYDPAFIDVAINKLNLITASPWDSRPGKIIIRFGTTATDLDDSHTYIGFITRVKLDLSAQGTFLDISLVSDAIDWRDVRVGPTTSRLVIKPYHDVKSATDGRNFSSAVSFSDAFQKVATYALWFPIYFDRRLDHVPIGEEFIMEERDTYLSFMTRIASKARTESGDQAYFHVYPAKSGGSPIYFFGSAAYAREQGLTGYSLQTPSPSSRLSFGSTDSNVIEARIDSDALFSAIYGSNTAIFRPYHLEGSTDDHAYIVLGGIPKNMTTAQAIEVVGRIQDKQRIIEIPMEVQKTPDSAKNNIYAYLNSLKRHFLSATLTVMGTHSLKILDVIQFDYYTILDGASVSNPVSGQYRCIGVQHDIDQTRGWVTTYHMQRESYNTGVDSADSDGVLIITPKDMQGLKQEIQDVGRKNDDAIRKKAALDAPSNSFTNGLATGKISPL